MNWGKKIALVYTGFVMMILTMVFMALQHKVELVTENYYEQELKFQEKIDKINRSNQLKNPLTVNFINGVLLVGFPRQVSDGSVRGTISVYSPVKKSNDRIYEITELQNFRQQIDLHGLPSGLYKIQIDWNADNVSYYNEKTINI